MTTPTQPADLLAPLLALERLSDACLSRRLTPAECGEFHAAIESLAAHRGEVAPVAQAYRPRNGDPVIVDTIDDFFLEPSRRAFLYRHPPQAQAGAGDAEGKFHKAIAPHLTKRLQGIVMGAFRAALEASHEPE